VIKDKWEIFKTVFEAHPYLAILFLYNKAQGKLEFNCDEEL